MDCLNVLANILEWIHHGMDINFEEISDTYTTTYDREKEMLDMQSEGHNISAALDLPKYS